MLKELSFVGCLNTSETSLLSPLQTNHRNKTTKLRITGEKRIRVEESQGRSISEVDFKLWAILGSTHRRVTPADLPENTRQRIEPGNFSCSVIQF